MSEITAFDWSKISQKTILRAASSNASWNWNININPENEKLRAEGGFSNSCFRFHLLLAETIVQSEIGFIFQTRCKPQPLLPPLPKKLVAVQLKNSKMLPTHVRSACPMLTVLLKTNLVFKQLDTFHNCGLKKNNSGQGFRNFNHFLGKHPNYNSNPNERALKQIQNIGTSILSQSSIYL